jgi:hypothetical protein
MSQQIQLSPGQRRLAQVMGMMNHELTELETELWQRLIDTYGDDAILRFLSEHVLRSKFAPRPAEAFELLSPGDNDSQVAFAQLVRAVKTVGPWETPAELNSNPVLMAAVQQMGGWASVNQTMPSTETPYDFAAFQKRFDAAFRLASSQVKIHGVKPERLLGAVDAHRLTSQLAQARLEAAQAAPAIAMSRPAAEDVIDAEPSAARHGERA